MIICDTREKKNQHILDYFDSHGVDYTLKKLDTGDYMTSENDTITVDRKQNLAELAQNLLSHDDSRFWRELRRAHDAHMKMIILCELGGQIKSIPDVAKWRSKYTNVTGKQLMNEIYRVHISYGVEFLFCDKRSTARKIIELLGYEQ